MSLREECEQNAQDEAKGYFDAIHAASEIDNAISHIDEPEQCLEDVENAMYYLQSLKKKQERLEAKAYANEMQRLSKASYGW